MLASTKKSRLSRRTASEVCGDAPRLGCTCEMQDYFVQKALLSNRMIGAASSIARMTVPPGRSAAFTPLHSSKVLRFENYPSRRRFWEVKRRERRAPVIP